MPAMLSKIFSMSSLFILHISFQFFAWYLSTRIDSLASFRTVFRRVWRSPTHRCANIQIFTILGLSKSPKPYAIIISQNMVLCVTLLCPLPQPLWRSARFRGDILRGFPKALQCLRRPFAYRVQIRCPCPL